MLDREWWRGVQAAWHYGRGKGAYKRGAYVEAAKRFRRSLELAPRNDDTKEWLRKSERAASSTER
ncbi:MAG: hypothetical protein ACREQQ_15795 [Candidatus Binatia bacterium]